MRVFTSLNEAKTEIRKITGENVLISTENGFRLLFTSEQKEDAKDAVKVLVYNDFSKVKLTGRGKFYVDIDWVDITSHNLIISRVIF